jgi:glycosyltransferase involved in cell wall biosynthesis
MRFLFLSNFFPPHHIGGYEELCAEVGDRLKQRRHSVAVVTTSHGVHRHAAPVAPVAPEEDVYRVLSPEVDLRPYRAMLGFFAGRGARLERNLAALDGVVTEVSPDVVIVWGMWNLARALPARAETRLPGRVVYYLADYWPSLPDAYTLYWKAPARRGSAALLKRVMARPALHLLARAKGTPSPRFERVVAVSQAVRDHLVRQGVPVGHARVVHNGIDVRAFARSARDAQTGRHPPGALSLLYAGRLSADKGVHTAIEAVGLAARCGCPARLTIVGTGSAAYEHELRGIAKRAAVADRVVLRGRVPRERMARELAAADVLVAPSIWPDPLPRTIQEGMAAGLVVIGSRVGGIPEIIEHGRNGMTFTPGAPRELADLIVRLERDGALRTRLAVEAERTVAGRFTIERMVDELEAYCRGPGDGGVSAIPWLAADRERVLPQWARFE